MTNFKNGTEEVYPSRKVVQPHLWGQQPSSPTSRTSLHNKEGIRLGFMCPNFRDRTTQGKIIFIINSHRMLSDHFCWYQDIYLIMLVNAQKGLAGFARSRVLYLVCIGGQTKKREAGDALF